METLIDIIGITGGLTLVTGSLINRKKHWFKKQFFLFLGAFFMLLYSALNFSYQNGAWQYVLLQAFASLIGFFGLFKIKQKIIIPFTIILGTIVTIIAFLKATGIPDFIISTGIFAIALGYILKNNILQNIAFVLGGILIVIFSYFVQDWIFLGLNFFFSLFSSYYVYLFTKTEEVK